MIEVRYKVASVALATSEDRDRENFTRDSRVPFYVATLHAEKASRAPQWVMWEIRHYTKVHPMIGDTYTLTFAQDAKA